MRIKKLIARNLIQIFDNRDVDVQESPDAIGKTRLIRRREGFLHAGVGQTLGEAAVREIGYGSLHLESSSFCFHKCSHVRLFRCRERLHAVNDSS